MNINKRTVFFTALGLAVLGPAATARAQGVQPLQPKELPPFILPAEPTEASAAETRGRTAYLSGDFSGAILAYTRLLQLRPNDAQAHFNRGLAELALDQNRVAERDFSVYIGLQAQHRSRYPANQEATSGYFQRGRARMGLNRFEDAISDFTQSLKGMPQSFIDVYNPPSPPDLFAFAFMERAAARYQISRKTSALVSSQEKNLLYAAVLADYDKALVQTAIRPEQVPVALFNRTLIVQTQAADETATPNAETATVQYAQAIKGYEAYLQAAPNATDAAQVKQHIAQIGEWLVADKNAVRPTPPAAFALKPTP